MLFLSNDCCLTVGTYRHDLHGHTRLLLDELNIRLQLCGEILVATNVVDVAFPALHLSIDRLNLTINRIVEVINTLAIDLVTNSNLDCIEVVHHIGLHHNQSRCTVDHNRILQCNQVQPAATTLTTRHSTILVTDIAQLLARLVEQLGGERTATYASAICLEDTLHITNPVGSNTQTSTGTCANGI